MGSYRLSRLFAASLALMVALAAGCALAGTQPATGVPAPAAAAFSADPPELAQPLTPLPTAQHPCGGMAGSPPHVGHVIVLMMENHAAPVLAAMPRLRTIAARCGRATGYHAVAHPSLPNYLALTSGRIPPAVAGSDCEPGGSCVSNDQSVFSQTGGSWRVWAQSMQSPCQRFTAGSYAVRHTAAPYYTNLRGQCAARQVPLGDPARGLAAALAADRLPAFGLLVPNIQDDQHDGCVACGDRFAARWLGRIIASDGYRRGQVAVFVTWDEDDAGHDNHVPLVAVSPYTPAGLRVGGSFTHYALLRTVERTLGYPPLGRAQRAPDTLGRALGLTG